MSDNPEYDYDDYDDVEHPQCPRCSGGGEIDCHCGGDLCVCTNYGTAICPLCAGDGHVSEATYEKYEQRQREMHEAFRKIVASSTERDITE